MLPCPHAPTCTLTPRPLDAPEPEEDPSLIASSFRALNGLFTTLRTTIQPMGGERIQEQEEEEQALQQAQQQQQVKQAPLENGHANHKHGADDPGGSRDSLWA